MYNNFYYSYYSLCAILYGGKHQALPHARQDAFLESKGGEGQQMKTEGGGGVNELHMPRTDGNQPRNAETRIINTNINANHITSRQNVVRSEQPTPVATAAKRGSLASIHPYIHTSAHTPTISNSIARPMDHHLVSTSHTSPLRVSHPDAQVGIPVVD